MPKVISFLDCGCAIMEGGGRTWCPTCMAGTVRSLFGSAPDLPDVPEESEAVRQLCSFHPSVNYRAAWGCPECLKELREELRQLRAAAAFAGNVIRNGKPWESLDDDERHALDWLNTLLPAEKGEKE